MAYRKILPFLAFMLLFPITLMADYKALGHYIDSSFNPTPANVGSLSASHYNAKIGNISAFLNSSTEKGRLTGTGNMPFTRDRRLLAFKNLLTTAESLYELGDIEGTCKQLNDAYMKSDGQITNDDYITGPAAPKLNQMIDSLLNDLGCKNKLA